MNKTDDYVTADGRTIGAVVMEMKNITLRFGGVTAIKDITFDIREGEIRAIIGPNGAGKTTSFYMMVGLVKTDNGYIKINNEDIKTKMRLQAY